MLKKMVGQADERLGLRLARLSIGMGAGLALLKILVGVAAHSTALLSDGVEAAGDVVSSGIVYAGLLLASRPPDRDHPYGHGRYETLAGLVIGALLAITGAFICGRSFSRLGQTHAIESYALIPLLIAVAAKTWLGVAKFRAARRVASASLLADAWHDVTDLASTFVALIAISLTLTDPARFHMADQVGGFLIGLLIIALSVRVIRDTVGHLVDTMPSDDMMRQVREVALEVPGAIGIEKCFARRTGLKHHVDLHLEVDPDLTVRESHAIAKHVKERVKDHLSWVADVLVHVEPSPAAAPKGNRSGNAATRR